MDPINWTPILEREGVVVNYQSADSDRLWIREHPIVSAARHTIVVRFTDLIQLQRLIEEVTAHYACGIISVVIKEGRSLWVSPVGWGVSSYHFGESQALLVFGPQLSAEEIAMTITESQR